MFFSFCFIREARKRRETRCYSKAAMNQSISFKGKKNKTFQTNIFIHLHWTFHLRLKVHSFKAFAYCVLTLRSVYFLTLNRSPVLCLHLLLSKNRYGAQRHTGNRGQLSVFYWSMCSSLLEGIDPVLVSNWPCCCCATPTQMSVRQAHCMLHFVPLCRAGCLKTAQTGEPRMII